MPLLILKLKPLFWQTKSKEILNEVAQLLKNNYEKLTIFADSLDPVVLCFSLLSRCVEDKTKIILLQSLN